MSELGCSASRSPPSSAARSPGSRSCSDYPAAHDALVKPVALIVHLFLLTIVLQCRWSVAARIRDPGEAGSSLALLHNWLARVWHYIAIFLHHRVMGSLGVRRQKRLFRLAALCIITILVVILARRVSIVALGGFERLFRINADFRSRYPGLDHRASRYYLPLRRILSGTIGVVTFLALLEAWGPTCWRGSTVARPALACCPR
jgi:moderate conductance mechanosensitive channel